MHPLIFQFLFTKFGLLYSNNNSFSSFDDSIFYSDNEKTQDMRTISSTLFSLKIEKSIDQSTF
jgi:hypothetical protein